MCVCVSNCCNKRFSLLLLLFVSVFILFWYRRACHFWLSDDSPCWCVFSGGRLLYCNKLIRHLVATLVIHLQFFFNSFPPQLPLPARTDGSIVTQLKRRHLHSQRNGVLAYYYFIILFSTTFPNHSRFNQSILFFIITIKPFSHLSFGISFHLFFIFKLVN